MRALLALTVAALFVIVAAPSEAAVFLKLEGVEGEATDRGHEGEIVLDSVQWGAQVETGQGDPRESGRPDLGTITLTKAYDASSPSLMEALLSGRTIESGLITFTVEGARGGVEYLTIALDSVVVTGVSSAANDGSRAFESVTLWFRSVTWRYVPIDPETGEPGRPVEASWDRTTATPL